MAIITGSIMAATKLLGGAMTKKAAVSGAKNFVKGKAVDKVTGRGRKKKKGNGGEGATEQPGAITQTGSSGIVPSSSMFGGMVLPDPVESKVQKSKSSGKVSFSSITNQLDSIVSLSASIESVTGRGIDTKKKIAATARKDKEKAKKREKEESKEGILSGVGGFLGNKAKEAGQKSGIFNFFTQLLLGTIALKLLDLARSLSKTFDSIGDAFGAIITGIKLFGLTIAAISKDLPNILKNAKKLFSKIKFGNKIAKLGTSFKNVLKRIGNLVPKFIKKSIQAVKSSIGVINKGAQALAKGLTLNTKGKSLGKTSAGLSKLLGGAGTGGAGAARNLGIGAGFRRLPGSSGRTNMYTLSKKARDIRAKHGNEAARMYQDAINNGVKPKRAMLNVRKQLKPGGKLTSTPMAGRLRGGMKGSQLLKGGLKQSGKRALIKFMGKGGAKAVLGTLGRIPIIGPLIVGVASFLETGKLDQALFRAGGALIGGFLGTFIPIPVIGTLMGELIGEYVGDLFYILLRGGGPEALGKKFQDDMKSLLTAGQAAMDWVGDGFKRMYEGIPKIKVPGYLQWLTGGAKEVPNPLWMINPFNIIQKTVLIGKAFFTRDPMIDGKVVEKSEESEKKRLRAKEVARAQRNQNIDTSKMDPSVAEWIERQKQLDIESGLVPDPNSPYVLRGPDGKPLVLGQSTPLTQKQGGGQQKLAILAYGTNEWGMSRSYIKSKTKDLIKKLMDKGYKVVVIPPSSGLVVFANPKGHVAVQDPHFGVIKAAEEMNAKLEYGQYSENDPLGKYVHLHPRYAKNVKAKYKPDIVVGDSNAALINGGQSVTAKDGASYTTVSDMIGGLSKQSTQSTQQRTSNDGPTRVMGNPTLTSQYGEMRGSKMHGGTDIAATQGAPLVPVTDATIVDYGKLSLTGAKRGDPSGWGNFIVYKDSQGYYHLYGHILESGMKTSGSVKKGEPIAKVGSTGKSSGPHLHWEMGTSWSGGTLGGKMDPLSVYKVNDPFTVGGRMSDNSETREVTRVSPSNNKPLTVPMDQIPGENAPQAEIDEYFRRLEAGELTGGRPSSQAQVSPTTPPVSQSSSVESQASYEQIGGGSPSIMTIPPPQQPSGGGVGRSNTIPSMGSGNLLNSYYRAQLLGFLYKQG